MSLGYGATGTYVAVSGTAKVVSDKAKIDELWTEDVKSWFPKGKDDPNLTLLRVDAERGEYWTFPPGPVSVAVGYVKAKLTGEPGDDLGENEKVAL